jgi:hypothetical protein
MGNQQQPPTDLMAKLRAIAQLELGEDFPKWMCDANGNWGTELSKLLNEAADQIGMLQELVKRLCRAG